MDLLTDQELQQKMDVAPVGVRSFIYSPSFPNAVLTVAAQHNLDTPGAIATLSTIAAETVLGIIPKNRLRAELQEHLTIAEGVAVEIADAIQRTIVTHEDEGEQKTEQQEPPAVASVPGSHAPEPSTPQPNTNVVSEHRQPSLPPSRPSIPLREDSLVRTLEDPIPRASQSAPLVRPSEGDPRRQPIPERTPRDIEEDPYKEPVEDNAQEGPQLDGNVVDLRS